MEHSQLSKARALGGLRMRLCKSGFGSSGTNPDLDWSVLAMLFNLATRPLDSVYPLPQLQQGQHQNQHSLVESLPGGRRQTVPPVSFAAEPGEGTASLDSDVDAHWDVASELSDWSQDSGEGAGGVQRPESPSMMQWEPSETSDRPPMQKKHQEASVRTAAVESIREPARSKPLGGDGSVWLQLAQVLSSRSPRTGKAGAQRPVGGLGASRSPARCHPDDLIQSLARARLGTPLPVLSSGGGGSTAGTAGGVGGVLKPGDCCEDVDLLHQALALMLGTKPARESALMVSSSARVAAAAISRKGGQAEPSAVTAAMFVWNAAIGGPVPRRGVHVPYLSQAQLRRVLSKVAATGGQMYRLRLVSELQASEGRLEIPSGMLRPRPPSASDPLRGPTTGPSGDNSTREGTAGQYEWDQTCPAPPSCAPHRVAVTPTVRAFLIALRAQVQRLAEPLAALQQLNVEALGRLQRAGSSGLGCRSGFGNLKEAGRN